MSVWGEGVPVDADISCCPLVARGEDSARVVLWTYGVLFFCAVEKEVVEPHSCVGVGLRAIWIFEVCRDVGYEAVGAGCWCVYYFVGVHAIVCRAWESGEGAVFDDYALGFVAVEEFGCEVCDVCARNIWKGW